MVASLLIGRFTTQKNIMEFICRSHNPRKTLQIFNPYFASVTDYTLSLAVTGVDDDGDNDNNNDDDGGSGNDMIYWPSDKLN